MSSTRLVGLAELRAFQTVGRAQRAALEQTYAYAVPSLPYETRYTPTWPISGGAPTWDDLAARVMFQFPRD